MLWNYIGFAPSRSTITETNESFHDQGAHFTRDISSDVPVKYDTRRYLNSLKGMI